MYWGCWQLSVPKVYFNPGEQWDYSNTGYVILAIILEKITGFTFLKYYRSIFSDH